MNPKPKVTKPKRQTPSGNNSNAADEITGLESRVKAARDEVAKLEQEAKDESTKVSQNSRSLRPRAIVKLGKAQEALDQATAALEAARNKTGRTLQIIQPSAGEDPIQNHDAAGRSVKEEQVAVTLSLASLGLVGGREESPFTVTESDEDEEDEETQPSKSTNRSVEQLDGEGTKTVLEKRAQSTAPPEERRSGETPTIVEPQNAGSINEQSSLVPSAYTTVAPIPLNDKDTPVESEEKRLERPSAQGDKSNAQDDHSEDQDTGEENEDRVMRDSAKDASKSPALKDNEDVSMRDVQQEASKSASESEDTIMSDAHKDAAKSAAASENEDTPMSDAQKDASKSAALESEGNPRSDAQKDASESAAASENEDTLMSDAHKDASKSPSESKDTPMSDAQKDASKSAAASENEDTPMSDAQKGASKSATSQEIEDDDQSTSIPATQRIMGTSETNSGHAPTTPSSDVDDHNVPPPALSQLYSFRIRKFGEIDLGDDDDLQDVKVLPLDLLEDEELEQILQPKVKQLTHWERECGVVEGYRKGLLESLATGFDGDIKRAESYIIAYNRAQTDLDKVREAVEEAKNALLVTQLPYERQALKAKKEKLKLKKTELDTDKAALETLADFAEVIAAQERIAQAKEVIKSLSEEIKGGEKRLKESTTAMGLVKAAKKSKEAEARQQSRASSGTPAPRTRAKKRKIADGSAKLVEAKDNFTVEGGGGGGDDDEYLPSNDEGRGDSDGGPADADQATVATAGLAQHDLHLQALAKEEAEEKKAAKRMKGDKESKVKINAVGRYRAWGSAYREEQSRAAYAALARYHISKDGKDISSSIRSLVRSIQDFCPEMVTYSMDLSLIILTKNYGATTCITHMNNRTDGRKLAIDSESLFTGQGFDPVVSGDPPEGHLHCGCSRDLAIMDLFLWKTTTVSSTNPNITCQFSMQRVPPPQIRAFWQQSLTFITGLKPADYLSPYYGSQEYVIERSLKIIFHALWAIKGARGDRAEVDKTVNAVLGAPTRNAPLENPPPEDTTTTRLPTQDAPMQNGDSTQSDLGVAEKPPADSHQLTESV